MATTSAPAIYNGIKLRDFTTGPGRPLAIWEAVSTFIWAGNARFTLRSAKTGLHFTYRVRVKKADAILEANGNLSPEVTTYFVEVLRGPDNTNHFSYAGVMRKPGTFWLTQASRVLRAASSVKALIWFLDAMTHERPVLGKTLEVWHEGRCGRCGRALTVPESIASGIGPECAKMGE